MPTGSLETALAMVTAVGQRDPLTAARMLLGDDDPQRVAILLAYITWTLIEGLAEAADRDTSEIWQRACQRLPFLEGP